MSPIVCFDVDSTLIEKDFNGNDVPKYDVIQLFRLFESFGCTMCIWSRGGIEHALAIRNALGLKAKIYEKGSFIPCISVDDTEHDLGKVNIDVSKKIDLKDTICF